ncbi:hypothetical protein B0T13DRAFT_59181 [Neurospora crassa]|nr:hypothetical protein B0T13DRAFT_59181 [Neurospora crassa]
MASKVDAPKIRSNIQQQVVLHQWRHDFSGCFLFLQIFFFFFYTGFARFSVVTDCLSQALSVTRVTAMGQLAYVFFVLFYFYLTWGLWAFAASTMSTGVGVFRG